MNKYPDTVWLITLLTYTCHSHTSNSELTELIESTKNTDSPFHISHTSNATDTTVHPAPSVSPAPAGPQPKKRKLDNGPSGADKAPAPSDTKYASFPNHVSANQHMVEKVHDIIKKESEELASLVVGNWLHNLKS